MKVLKYILLLLFLGFFASFVFFATQASSYSISKSIDLEVTKNTAFNFINEYENWKLWYPSIMNSKVENETISPDRKTLTIKDGTEKIIFETIKTNNLDSISQKLFENNLSHTIEWTFKETKIGTQINCEMKGALSLKQKFFSFLKGGVENYMDDELEKSLANIKNYLDKELKSNSIKVKGIVTKPETFYIYQVDSCSLTDFNDVSKIKVKNLLEFVKNNQITHTEAPFILFDYWDTRLNKTKFSICLPVSEEVVTTEGSDVMGGFLPSFKAAKIITTGDYSHTRKAWNIGFKYLYESKLSQDYKGSFIEQYIVYYPKEKKPSKWVTEIYIPVKPKTYRRTYSTSNSEENSSETPTEPNSNPTNDSEDNQ